MASDNQAHHVRLTLAVLVGPPSRDSVISFDLVDAPTVMTLSLACTRGEPQSVC